MGLATDLQRIWNGGETEVKWKSVAVGKRIILGVVKF